jgi:hypothetical protein
MGKQDRPAVSDPFMKIDRALGGFGGEVWGLVIDAQHVDLLDGKNV